MSCGLYLNADFIVKINFESEDDFIDINKILRHAIMEGFLYKKWMGRIYPAHPA